jgi:predicted nucleotidyltransferase
MGMNSIRLSDALFSKVQQRVLGLLFVNSDRSFYTNEIVRLVDSGMGVVQRELTRLTSSGLITALKIGNQRHYQADPTSPIFKELRSILLKTSGLAYVLKTALLPVADSIEVAFVFGSIAKGTDNAKSDIDLLVVSDTLSFADLFNFLNSCETSLGRPINPSIYTRQELKRKWESENTFVTRVLEQPKIFLVGSDNDIPKS